MLTNKYRNIRLISLPNPGITRKAAQNISKSKNLGPHSKNASFT